MRHPAPFTPTIIDVLRNIVAGEHVTTGRTLRVLDPFAGTGRIHRLADHHIETVGVELEPEWAAADHRTIVGDATALPFADDSFDVLASSPTYANRLADTYDGRDGSRRFSYTTALGRTLTVGNTGSLQWTNPAYKELHAKAWSEAYRVIRPHGLFVINVSNHIRRGVEQHVVEWHLSCFLEMGCRVQSVEQVHTPRQRFGKNGDLRVDSEKVLVLRAP